MKDQQQHDEWLEEVLPLREAAALRKISTQTMRSLIRQQKLRAIKLSPRKLGMQRREALRSIR